MLLNNVTGMEDKTPVNRRVANGQITVTNDKTQPGEIALHFNNAIIFPGLVNSHDHLDFNLFPQLGSGIYNNYTEWGRHIHAIYKQEIAAVLKVPLQLRLQWGIYKNMLCGVTTVVNHGEQLEINDAPITVKQYHSIHSVQFDKGWKKKLNNPLKIKQSAVIHTGEGTDELAGNEIDQLIKWNLLNRKLIGVHGVAMSAKQAKAFKALVWCPGSNYFLLNQTARIDQLKKATNILFGTDSTLTGSWNIWAHIRQAWKTALLTNTELYHSLNVNAAAVWGTANDSVVVAKRKDGSTWLGSFLSTEPPDILLVVSGGIIRLFDESLLPQLTLLDISVYGKIQIGGVVKYVYGDLPGLMKQIKDHYPEASFPVSAS